MGMSVLQGVHRGLEKQVQILRTDLEITGFGKVLPASQLSFVELYRCDF